MLLKTQTADGLPLEGIGELIADNIDSTQNDEARIQYANAHARNDDFEKERLLILRRWSKFFEGKAPLTEETATSFIRRFLNNLNHRLLFNESITIGKTRFIVGESLLDDVISFYDSNRKAWTFQLTIEGSGSYSFGETIPVEPGTAILLAPEATCHFHRTLDSNRWVHYWVVFEPKPEWLELLKWPTLSQGIYKLDISEPDTISQIVAVFDEALKHKTGETPLTSKLHNNLFEQVLIRTSQDNKELNIAPFDLRIEKACQYLKENFTKNVSISQLAQHCQLSESRLSHLFREKMAISINQYKIHLRLQYAKQALIETNNPISVISDQLGFPEPSQFSKFFTKHAGKNPKKFRDDHTNS
ncbi:arabinose operon transcriptional regulator AraC [Maricurvus nonylphenolicus]